MDLKLTGKVALVTGARTGIGFSICEELAMNGVHLVMVARREPELILAAKKFQRNTVFRCCLLPGM